MLSRRFRRPTGRRRLLLKLAPSVGNAVYFLFSRGQGLFQKSVVYTDLEEPKTAVATAETRSRKHLSIGRNTRPSYTSTFKHSARDSTQPSLTSRLVLIDSALLPSRVSRPRPISSSLSWDNACRSMLLSASDSRRNVTCGVRKRPAKYLMGY